MEDWHLFETGGKSIGFKKKSDGIKVWKGFYLWLSEQSKIVDEAGYVVIKRSPPLPEPHAAPLLLGYNTSVHSWDFLPTCTWSKVTIITIMQRTPQH